MAVPFSREASSDPTAPTTLPPLFLEPGELRDYAGFAVRSLGRRWKLVGSILLLFVAALGAAVRYLPRRYHVEARMLALPAEGAPGALRGNNGDASLLQSAAEVIVSRQNVLELIREHDLLARWESSRGPMLQLWDRLRRRPIDPVQRERALVRSFEKRLTVQVKGPHVILGFDWPEPQTAVEVVKTAEAKLIAARRDAELVPLERKVATLEASAAAARRRVDLLAARVQDAVTQKRHGARAATVRALQAEGRFRDLPDPSLSRQRLQVVALRKAIAELEDVRRRRVSELNAALAEQTAMLGPGNPALLETREKIRALAGDGPELATLKARQEGVFAAYVQAGGKEIELSADPGPWPAELKEDDPVVAFDKSRMGLEQSSLARLVDQAAEAEVTLATAAAGFDSRYVEMLPPELPEGPAFPNLLLLVFAGLLAGAVVAFFGAVAADLSGGIIREGWQARRELDVPLLAQIPEP
jgi:uncharacterized protein involved in exopolysaccharide biosynthesis